jgi:hypothetical protein
MRASCRPGRRPPSPGRSTKRSSSKAAISATWTHSQPSAARPASHAGSSRSTCGRRRTGPTVQLEADRARTLGVRGVPTYGRNGRPTTLAQDGRSLREFLVALLAQPTPAGARTG